MSPMRSAMIAAIGIGALATLAGCGDLDLWARYRAERGFWQARRRLRAIEIEPRLAAAGDYARAAAAFRAVADAYPAAVWTDPAHLARPVARDVALLSGRAAVAAARVRESHGETAAALAGYRDAETAFAAVPEVVLDARLARAAALDRAGRGDEATVVRIAIAREGAIVDADGTPNADVLAAPLRVARNFAARGLTAAADSTLRATEAHDLQSLAALHGAAAVAVWERLAGVRTAGHRTGAAIAALRGAVGALAPEDGRARADLVLRMADCGVSGGLPDSALAYARWAESAFDRRTRAAAMVLEARAFETLDRPDSALAAWARLLDDFPAVVGVSSNARFRRGRLYEDLGRWEQARGEYRTLIASDPTHPLAFTGLQRIVAWHVRHGEQALARIEGQRGIESLDQLIATHRDEDVQHRARTARAEVLMTMEDWPAACLSLGDLWNRYGDGGAGLRAAEVAESRLHDTERARRLYRDIADRADDAERRSARDALARLEGAHGP
ncbi:MAG: tetratricopeptide repeat protein [Candidatus Eisenbacteria bacterium]|nr:tetratricopeptide repeat protein [Candidatus Eisenbacteria bacterium]